MIKFKHKDTVQIIYITSIIIIIQMFENREVSSLLQEKAAFFFAEQY